jgi:Tfp pilus assembly protein PilX
MKNLVNPLLGQPLVRREYGVSLIIVLLMLVIIGLTSAAAIRNATSGERATNNIRMQNLAQQYAEAALRYCETQLELPDLNRVATLQNAKIFNDSGAGVAKAATANFPATGWSQTITWTGVGGASTSLTNVPAARLQSANSAFVPAVAPQCVAERQRLSDNSEVTVVTARGFSPDYASEAGTGKTTAGSVVWLQSTIRLI